MDEAQQAFLTWLETRGLGAHAEVLLANDIDLEVLAELSEDDLAGIGLTLGARKKLLKAVRADLEEAQTEPAPPPAPAAPADAVPVVEVVDDDPAPPPIQPPPLDLPEIRPLTDPSAAQPAEEVPEPAPPAQPVADDPSPPEAAWVDLATPPPPAQPRSDREKLIAGLVTILAHVAIIPLLFLIVLTAPKILPPQIEAVVTVASPEPEVTRKKVVQQTAPQPPSAPASATQMITAFAASPVSVPTIEIEAVDDVVDLGSSIGAGVSFGTGSSPGAGAGGVFFGSRVSGEMAVVFDITGSMFHSVERVLKELQRPMFRNARVVAVFGGSFKRRNLEMRLVPYRDNEGLHKIEIALAPGGKLGLRDEIHEKLRSRRLSEAMEVHAELAKARGQRQSLGAALELLLRDPRGPGTIFIFSDFEDGVDQEYMDETQRLARRRNPKIVFYHPKTFRKDKAAYDAFVAAVGGGSEVKEVLPD